MMENASHDRMVGDLTKEKPELEGIDQSKDINKQNFNLDNHGNKIYQREITSVQMPLDPFHEVADVHQQFI